MPGVRYGPDISDDAAFLVDRVKTLQEKLNRKGRLSNREARQLDEAARFARDVFGVRRSDFDKGRLGDMGEMAKYGGGRSRSRAAKSWRSGGPMKKSVAKEMADRGSGRTAKRDGSTKSLKEPFYTGRTRSKKFQELEQRAMKRAKRNGFQFGKQKAAKNKVNPGNFKAQVDNLNISKAGKGSSFIGSRAQGRGVAKIRTGSSIRPPKPKSQARAKQRLRKR